jgi:AAA15 family ATPase/GTPase
VSRKHKEKNLKKDNEIIKIKDFFNENDNYLKHAFENKTIDTAREMIIKEDPSDFIDLVKNKLKWFDKMQKDWTAKSVIDEIKIAKADGYLP